MKGLIWSIIAQKKFLGSWKEDVDSTACLYKVLETMCEVTNDERLKAISTMLLGDTLPYY